MILHTGGLAFGETQTRSSPTSAALSRASFLEIMPTCSPSAPISLTSLALIPSFTNWSFIMLHPRVKLKNSRSNTRYKNNNFINYTQ